MDVPFSYLITTGFFKSNVKSNIYLSKYWIYIELYCEYMFLKGLLEISRDFYQMLIEDQGYRF